MNQKDKRRWPIWLVILTKQIILYRIEAKFHLLGVDDFIFKGSIKIFFLFFDTREFINQDKWSVDKKSWWRYLDIEIESTINIDQVMDSDELFSSDVEIFSLLF